MFKTRITFLFSLLFISLCSFTQEIPSNSVIKTEKLYDYLKEDVKKEIPNTEADLDNYCRKAFSERFFYDYHTVQERFELYTTSFPEAKTSHLERAKDHISKFGTTTP
jgi:hypothetical protein